MIVYKQKTILEPVEMDETKLCTQAEASKILGITAAGVRSAMDAGRLPTYFMYSLRGRMTLREAVIEMKASKGDD